MEQVLIRDLAVIGDRRSCALISKLGDVVWFCPKRFDKPAVFTSLIDPDKGGSWSFTYKSENFLDRKYEGRSGVLRTRYEGLEVFDFMPLDAEHHGIFRIFSEAPNDIENVIYPKPYYGLGLPEYDIDEELNVVTISRSLYFTASHPLSLKNGRIRFTIPKGEKGWAFLSDEPFGTHFTAEEAEANKQKTLEAWNTISRQLVYEGIYEQQVQDSIRAIQLMTFQENGGIIAAATTSLPEVPGEHRNYDYRYVWLRDAAMITGALVRANSNGEEARKFLSFLCDAKVNNSQKILLPFYSLDKVVAQPEEQIPLDGYLNSRPVRVGNDAMDQLQLDANANIILAAKLIYERFHHREHWETVSSIADHLVERWQEKDHGIWEETAKEHFTSSKVIVAKALEFLADFTEVEEQKIHWLNTAEEIRKFIEEKCLTAEGAYATYPGSGQVDITSTLFPVWLFTEPDAPAMKKTIELLERDHKEGDLFRRTLTCYDAAKEGIFLAGCLWMAQYYIMANNLQKAQKTIKAALKFSNDLGFFAEEGDIETGEMLGNFPQTFVHASFIGVIIDLNKEMQ